VGLGRFRFINRGIAAQTSAQALGRFEEDVVPLSPDVVVVQVGINDLSAIPLFPDRKEAIVAACAGNIEALVGRARATGATVILTTIFPLGDVPPERRLFEPAGMGEAVAEVNEHLRSLEGEGVILMDTAAVLVDEQGRVGAAYSEDLLHLTPAAYEALNGVLEGLLRRVE
jgi:lysophospholipase L1-like esterase